MRTRRYRATPEEREGFIAWLLALPENTMLMVDVLTSSKSSRWSSWRTAREDLLDLAQPIEDITPRYRSDAELLDEVALWVSPNGVMTTDAWIAVCEIRKMVDERHARRQAEGE